MWNQIDTRSSSILEKIVSHIEETIVKSLVVLVHGVFAVQPAAGDIGELRLTTKCTEVYHEPAPSARSVHWRE